MSKTPPDTTPAEPKPVSPKAQPEGPHARPDLIDPDKTPGSGMFPQPGTKDSEPPAG
ncbi:hypothetical protein C8P69_10354 [Phreatobacter oligotrophus]|uniref:Uncharacterized protein n=1 Tax=Phreatobacter oligotrophus TaxID=1122261 RepID=A0A2T4ZE16_9HYPH|nr:hypothetical protein C8P69_10354 [Phreatobacter oligotrophus]